MSEAIKRGATDGGRYAVVVRPGYGNVVVSDHGTVAGHDISTLYAHLSGFSAHVGESVRRDEVIGRVGSTGNSTGPHCTSRSAWTAARSLPTPTCDRPRAGRIARLTTEAKHVGLSHGASFMRCTP